MAIYLMFNHQVTLTVNGEERNIATFATSVTKLLKEEHVEVSKYDYLSVKGDTPLKDGMKIVYKKAVSVTVVKDGEEKEYWVVSDTIEEMLKEKNIEVSEHDFLSLSKDAKVESGLSFQIETGRKVALKDGLNETIEVWTTQDVLDAFLEEQGIVLGDFDRVETNEQQVTIIRGEKKEEKTDMQTDFAVVTKKDSSLEEGKKKVVQEGSKGLISQTYEVYYENGEEVKRNLLHEETKKTPTDKVIAVGTRKLVSVASRGKADSSQEIYVTATAYSANCNGCSGITATGINLKNNPDAKVIAVDPSVIPLGTKVWVEGYGYAIAADKGSAIKGHKIDVFFSDSSKVRNWGRKQVKIRIL